MQKDNSKQRNNSSALCNMHTLTEANDYMKIIARGGKS
jgi:hypothetical protein